MMKTRLKILIILLIAIVAISTVSAVSAAVDSVDSKDKVYSIESKEKSAANKITWNANGGTVNSKKTITTNVKKGSKIGKLPATPKRSGYTFSGWYTKKSGGSKISVNTKPTKAVTYYAQWKVTPKKDDKNNNNNQNAKALVGKYGNPDEDYSFHFKADGTYVATYGSTVERANWALTTKGAIRFTNYRVDGKSGYIQVSDTYYVLDKVNGKSGIRTSVWPDKVKTDYFYQKM